jgi:hypothetical protein
MSKLWIFLFFLFHISFFSFPFAGHLHFYISTCIQKRVCKI